MEHASLNHQRVLRLDYGVVVILALDARVSVVVL